MTARELRVLPIAIGTYQDAGYPDLAADDEAAAVVGLLDDFRPQLVPWDVPADQRALDSVTTRLAAWSGDDSNVDTILYWVGHGWSTDTAAGLATFPSPHGRPAFSITPADLAEQLSEHEGRHPESWTIAIFDACHSKRFAELLNLHLYADPPGAAGRRHRRRNDPAGPLPPGAGPQPARHVRRPHRDQPHRPRP
jgi:hypothetical protein